MKNFKYEVGTEIHFKRENLMTVILGIICEDGIVMASDSQAMSDRGVDVKRMDFTKLYNLNGELKIKGIIGGAGGVPFINKAVQIIKDKCKGDGIKELPKLIEAAENSITELTKKYAIDRINKLGLAKNGKEATTVEIQGIPHLGTVLMLACVEDGKACLSIISPDGVAEEEQHFGSIGSGSAYAEYILSKLHFEKISVKEGIELAVYVIEEVKKIDPNVGGDAQVTYIDLNGYVTKIEPKLLLELMQKVRTRDELISQLWKKLIAGKIAEDKIKSLLS